MCGRRAFAIAGPSAWSSLLDPVCNPNSTEAVFGRLLKTLLFAQTVLKLYEKIMYNMDNMYNIWS